ncbi:hypothetical protein Kpol_1002p3 [Vanderwaltozyma polyspora DSM 70294]|uniref:Seipin n=1 Tax=Vanderwaltozyma polyspora (strain ATCC 22028 / DSM 70294 / BCRC 21397 / CBS 2163 / NBRC 10782 / NRRL Y-8283 / UCD 57-17) TaxID=436907 RepID=A7TE36_VANPO|nr:uncharacterized protein Kpol_1002p3 [Vanderwaltozyma polyspora DSM 70294]EDO19358.1 hypothetical protein Kpol_1002p3 [Vanderwaltozyma polyspora DSM 70294]
MLVNVTRPLQLLQWSSYIAITCLVQLLIILPLSILIFHDFYARLLPPDSSQWVPLSTSNTFDFEKFDQYIDRISIDKPLPPILDNGLSQMIPLRDYILYKMDLDYKFYCLKDSVNRGYKSPLDTLQLRVSVATTDDDVSTVIYRRNIPIVCIRDTDSISTEGLSKIGPNRLKVFEKEWQNHIDIEDKISIDPDVVKIYYDFIPGSPSMHLKFDPKSGARYRMEFQQGFRNIMLRWRKLTHIFGTLVCYVIISTLFSVTGVLSFYLVNQKELATGTGTDTKT